MVSKQYWRTFLIQFSGYFGIFIGLLAILFEFGPVLGSEFGFRYDQLLGVQHTLATTLSNRPGSSPGPQNGDTITPISDDFDIVIEKINANAKVIPDVDPNNEQQYVAALTQGVAEAKGSTPPGEPGNLYIFSHSVDAPWNIVRYNAVFYLLRELVPGDQVIIIYHGKRYNYIVMDKHIVDPSDTSYLTNRYNKPILTLQTCDPPGMLIHRLIVRAQLAGS